jgi:hypothetical protein
MIEKYINEKIVIIPIYYKVQIYFKNHSNDYQSSWTIESYITYEFIVPFQFYMKSSIHMNSQKKLDEVFHSNKCKCVNT